MTPDHLSEMALIEVSRWQREAMEKAMNARTQEIEMARQFPKTEQITTITKGMRLVDEEFDFFEVTYTDSRAYVGLKREDGRSMGAGSWVHSDFAKLRYKAVAE